MSAKKSDPSADTSALEAEIDQMIYKLYGLTEKEIRARRNNDNGNWPERSVPLRQWKEI